MVNKCLFIYQYDEYIIDFAVLILWREKSATQGKNIKLLKKNDEMEYKNVFVNKQAVDLSQLMKFSIEILHQH